MSLSERLGQIWDSFSMRHGAHGSGYKPDEISDRLRNRVLMLFADIVSGRRPTSNVWGQGGYGEQFFEELQHALCTVYGRPVLSKHSNVRTLAEDATRFAENSSASELFDIIEASFKLEVAWRVFRPEDEAVDALNAIFRLEQSPYQVLHGVERQGLDQHGHTTIMRVAFPRVVRVDEEVAHKQAVLPALSALSDPAYAGADDEFRKALQDYRNGDYEDCLGKCGSAFESVLKVLCDKNRIAYDKHKDTAGPLLDKLLGQSALDTETFKDRLFIVGRLRNRLSSSHGGGAQVRKVERHVAQYAVTSTAAAIVLLVQDMGK